MTIDFKIGSGKTVLYFSVDEKKRVRMRSLAQGIPDKKTETFLNEHGYLCEAEITGRGTTWHSGDRHIFCSESDRLEYVRHEYENDEAAERLCVVQEDDLIRVESRYTAYRGSDTVECAHTVTNLGEKPCTLEYISVFSAKGLMGFDRYKDTYLYRSTGGWYTECQWAKFSLAQLGIFCGNPVKSMKKYSVSNSGTWSTKSYLPMGILEDEKNKSCFLWQINSNASWSFEIGDLYSSISLDLSGPTLQENGWARRLNPGDSYTTVSAVITFAEDLNGVLKNVTAYRRKIASAVADKNMPIVFNEYMYGSWNCPSEESADKFSRVAETAGADYFIIDCGWHDEVRDPFYYVGKWKPSKSKYPHGLKATADKVRARGMKFGLWLEPEVVGALGDAKESFSEDCFLKRFGEPLLVSNRYQLDFRNKKVCEYLNKVIDDLSEELKIEYVKFDYNIEIGIGVDSEKGTIGFGLEENARAYIDWLEQLKMRHPEIMIEACASGGNRMDYLTMQHCHMTSTSDQTDYTLYPYIIANMLSALLPEQAAVWVYPVSDRMPFEKIDDDCVAMNLINGMSGRISLASDMSRLDEAKFALVREGIDYYKYMTPYRAIASPWLPLGFAEWGTDRLAFGLDAGEKKFLFVYDLGGKGNFEIPVGDVENIKIGYPSYSSFGYAYKDGTLNVALDGRTVAAVYELKYRRNAQ